jgi:NADP-dependent 3-hydroxy acid dehydrogenase YdfG
MPPTGKESIMQRIEDKVVAIKGASTRIGEATALLLAERRAQVVLGARGPDRLKALAARYSRRRIAQAVRRNAPPASC